jgi:hypothetical protein|tara:strand:+ start:429 stop:653 length:225 start_codon:yes stop_codon:yes gene_type:complete
MQKKPKTTRKKKIIDPCPVCDMELHINNKYTEKIGLIDEYEKIIGWICPHCDSEFDVDDHLVRITGGSGQRGEA